MNSSTVRIQVDDPWDLGEMLGWRELDGEIVRFFLAQDTEFALICLEEPITYQEKNWRYLVAKPRKKEEPIRNVASERLIGCSLIGVDDSFKSLRGGESDVISQWRGGLAFIGDVYQPT